MWGSAGLILRSAARRCPESANDCGKPTLSQVYLELVHQFVLLNEVLFRDVIEAAKKCRSAQHLTPKILSVFDIEEINYDNSEGSSDKIGKTVKVIDNIRNAFAHGRARIKIIDENKNTESCMLAYDGSLDKFGPNVKLRPLEDICVLGKLMKLFTLSVISASGILGEE